MRGTQRELFGNLARAARLAAAIPVVAGATSECASPTAIQVDVVSELPCGEAGAALFVARSLAELEATAPRAVSGRCDATGDGASRLGSVVLTPSGAPDEEIALAVAQRDDGASPEACARLGAPPSRCVVARRSARFVRGETLRLRIDLRAACVNTACPAAQTCVRGSCVSATLAEGCAPSCTELDLRPAGPDGGAVVLPQLEPAAVWKIPDGGPPGLLAANTSIPELRRAILAYVDAHNQTARPFTWTKTPDQIVESVRRIGERILQVHP